jgi:hypothetical protein
LTGLELHAVLEFQFRYNNRFNADIFGAAIEGAWPHGFGPIMIRLV